MSTKLLKETGEYVWLRAYQLGMESGVGYAEAFVSQHRQKRVLDLFPTRR